MKISLIEYKGNEASFSSCNSDVMFAPVLTKSKSCERCGMAVMPVSLTLFMCLVRSVTYGHTTAQRPDLAHGDALEICL